MNLTRFQSATFEHGRGIMSGCAGSIGTRECRLNLIGLLNLGEVSFTERLSVHSGPSSTQLQTRYHH